MRLLAFGYSGGMRTIRMRPKHIERSEGTFRAIERGRGHRYGYRTLSERRPVQTEVITGKALTVTKDVVCKIFWKLNASITFNPSDMGSGIQMNGLGNDYILILINGKRINGDTGGQNDLSIINPANIERIEIVKGAASSLYGSDAIAGVINIITKKEPG